MLELCCENIKQALKIAKKVFATADTLGDHLRRIKLLAKLYMQLCAILSQQNFHEEAQNYAIMSAQFAHLLIKQLHNLCGYYTQKIERTKLKGQYEDFSVQSPISLIEICSVKLLPIFDELEKRMVHDAIGTGENEKKSNKTEEKVELDMRNMFGFLNLNDWAANLNIGNIMVVGALTLQDVLSKASKDVELSREAIVEKISLVATSYFCIATEKRFIHQRDHPAIDKVAQYAYNEPNKERYFLLNFRI